MRRVQPTTIDYCANWLADSIISLSKHKPTAWIIDLRLNSGGQTIPMMAALASFFEEGTISYYVDKTGKMVSKSVIRNQSYIQEDG